MTNSPALPVSGKLPSLPLSDRAAQILTTELTRDRGPKTGLLLDVTPDSPVLAAVLDGLLPGDRLTIVGAEQASALRAHLTSLGSWVAERVQIVDSLAEAEAADVVIIGAPVDGAAEETRERLAELGKYLADGAVLCVATAAFGGGSAAAELERQAALFGVGSDLVLRQRPPVRVHRLRYTEASPATADRLAPAARTSSVPLTRNMHIDSNGVAAAGIALGIAGLMRAGRRSRRLWWAPALAAPAVAAFFRDPQRDVPEDRSAIVAASDGRVLAVERITDDRFGPENEYLRIAVFLSVLDVHVNRSPVAGRVVDYFVTDGGFAAAMKPGAEHNVAAYTVLDTTAGRVVVAQRTGLIARRIVQRAPIGALLARGERFGLIRFGSRTDIYLPAETARVVVAPGDRVLGGNTVVAHWIATPAGA
ncbi:phosphatidylserine decarboxylase [Pilimelia columellifera]|uniref:Phosphatidylserine decarboxylase n=1 Tax=Pilimelia columellifera subsp. columellifera TaxID=706583 RepID=A0ABN3NFH2_9ACTN